MAAAMVAPMRVAVPVRAAAVGGVRRSPVSRKVGFPANKQSAAPAFLHKSFLGSRGVSATTAAASALASSSAFAETIIAPIRQTVHSVVRFLVTCHKGGQGAMKRSRSNKSKAGVSGFRARMQSANGRQVLARRRTKGRKMLCPVFNSPTGKHQPALKKYAVF